MIIDECLAMCGAKTWRVGPMALQYNEFVLVEPPKMDASWWTGDIDPLKLPELVEHRFRVGHRGAVSWLEPCHRHASRALEIK